MSGSPWGDFEAKVKNRQTLPPLKLGKKEFVFPASPPASAWYELKRLEKANAGKPISNDEAAELLLPMIVSEETLEDLLKEITVGEIGPFMMDLFKAWGWKTDQPEEADPPNRQARRASQKRSGSGSARSKRTSSATTG